MAIPSERFENSFYGWSNHYWFTQICFLTSPPGEEHTQIHSFWSYDHLIKWSYDHMALWSCGLMIMWLGLWRALSCWLLASVGFWRRSTPVLISFYWILHSLPIDDDKCDVGPEWEHQEGEQQRRWGGWWSRGWGPPSGRCTHCNTTPGLNFSLDFNVIFYKVLTRTKKVSSEKL